MGPGLAVTVAVAVQREDGQPTFLDGACVGQERACSRDMGEQEETDGREGDVPFEFER
jgi:hypothetical protein